MSIRTSEEFLQSLKSAKSQISELLGARHATIPPEVPEADIRYIADELTRIQTEVENGCVSPKRRRSTSMGRIVVDQMEAWSSQGDLADIICEIGDYYRRKLP